MTVDDLLYLGKLSLTFGRVERATLHEDGERPETDTDHTFMLTLVACSLASKHPELGLDVGLVCQLAQVHDLVEVYAGDTPTLDPSMKTLADKVTRELNAMNRLRVELAPFPWLLGILERYERQACDESCFVRYVDKLMPKITHLLNEGAALPALGCKTRQELWRILAEQRATLENAYDDLTVVDQLFGALMLRCELDLPERFAGADQ